MQRLMVRLALAAIVAVSLFTLAAPAFASSTAPGAVDAGIAAQESDGDDSHDVVPGAVWALVGTVVGAVVLGVLYLFKRRVGGFPKNPDWVAPISIERSETFAKEGDYGDVAPDAHGSHH